MPVVGLPWAHYNSCRGEKVQYLQYKINYRLLSRRLALIMMYNRSVHVHMRYFENANAHVGNNHEVKQTKYKWMNTTKGVSICKAIL